MVAQFIKLWPSPVSRLLKAQSIHSDDLRVRDTKIGSVLGFDNFSK